ncbi:AraC family transcriptional regulator [Halalkalibacter alkalisediminis]|uniref:AraC family transcriptional regulator n=1 Tax=Halalkalibacter alkalisediminis TaxID=935616 RepID=A0ABV6NIK8_9BACI|nr:AraC family transcriptional regulator [Halalkalibacter alkalisediminis]
MDPKDLDKMLFKMSPIEENPKNFEGKFIKSILSADHLIPHNENISLLKHPRFVTTPKHAHDYIEMIYVYSGSIAQIINNEEIILSQGEICILDTSVEHSLPAVGENDIIINILLRKNYFSSSLISRLANNRVMTNFLINAMYENKKQHYIHFKSGGNKKIHHFMVELMCEYYDKSICSEEIINCYLVLTFSELLKVYQTSMIGKSKDKEKVVISTLLNYIEANFKTLTLQSMAEHFNYHPNYLSSLLKRKTSKTLKEIMNGERIREAATLLDNTDLTVERICNEVGYNNVSFFYKQFQKVYHTTPSKYRKSSKL